MNEQSSAILLKKFTFHFIVKTKTKALITVRSIRKQVCMQDNSGLCWTNMGFEKAMASGKDQPVLQTQ
jgi:hypothetical protein